VINESSLYAFMKERLRAICVPANDLRAYYSKANLADDSVRYGKSMMLLRVAHDPVAARQMLSPLVKPGMPATVAMLQAKLLTKTGEVDRGLQLAVATQQQSPDDKGLTLELADLYLENKKTESAKMLMRHALLRSPDDPDFYARLSRAYTDLGDNKLAYLAKGDYAMSLHMYERAMFSLKSAEKEPPKSPYYQSLIEAKIKENEELLKKQKRIRKSLDLPDK
jgi:predicted Zn-dependent protease